MENKKLTSEELQELKDINARYSTVVSYLGETEIFIANIQEQISKAMEDKKGFLADFQSLKEKSNELYTKLTEKYGSGKINLDTGEIEPS